MFNLKGEGKKDVTYYRYRRFLDHFNLTDAEVPLLRANFNGLGMKENASVGTGFNGCLSTVSTFVTEIRKLTPKVRVPGERPSARPALYAGTSVVIGLGLFLLVNGPGYAHQWSPSAK